MVCYFIYKRKRNLFIFYPTGGKMKLNIEEVQKLISFKKLARDNKLNHLVLDEQQPYPPPQYTINQVYSAQYATAIQTIRQQGLVVPSNQLRLKQIKTQQSKTNNQTRRRKKPHPTHAPLAKYPLPLAFAYFQSYHQQQQFSKAISVIKNHLDRKITTNPHIINYNLSYLYRDVQDSKKAIFHLQSSLKQKPFFQYAVFDYAYLLAINNRTLQALQILKRHLINLPNSNTISPLSDSGYIQSMLLNLASKTKAIPQKQVSKVFHNKNIKISTYFNLGLYFKKVRNFERASGIYKQIIQSLDEAFKQERQKNPSFSFIQKDQKVYFYCKLNLSQIYEQQARQTSEQQENNQKNAQVRAYKYKSMQILNQLTQNIGQQTAKFTSFHLKHSQAINKKLLQLKSEINPPTNQLSQCNEHQSPKPGKSAFRQKRDTNQSKLKVKNSLQRQPGKLNLTLDQPYKSTNRLNPNRDDKAEESERQELALIKQFNKKYQQKRMQNQKKLKFLLLKDKQLDNFFNALPKLNLQKNERSILSMEKDSSTISNLNSFQSGKQSSTCNASYKGSVFSPYPQNQTLIRKLRKELQENNILTQYQEQFEKKILKYQHEFQGYDLDGALDKIMNKVFNRQGQVRRQKTAQPEAKTPRNNGLQLARKDQINAKTDSLNQKQVSCMSNRLTDQQMTRQANQQMKRQADQQMKRQADQQMKRQADQYTKMQADSQQTKMQANQLIKGQAKQQMTIQANQSVTKQVNYQTTKQANQQIKRQANQLTTRQANQLTTRQAKQLTTKQTNQLTTKQTNQLTTKEAKPKKEIVENPKIRKQPQSHKKPLEYTKKTDDNVKQIKETKERKRTSIQRKQNMLNSSSSSTGFRIKLSTNILADGKRSTIPKKSILKNIPEPLKVNNEPQDSDKQERVQQTVEVGGQIVQKQEYETNDLFRNFVIQTEKSICSKGIFVRKERNNIQDIFQSFNPKSSKNLMINKKAPNSRDPSRRTSMNLVNAKYDIFGQVIRNQEVPASFSARYDQAAQLETEGKYVQAFQIYTELYKNFKEENLKELTLLGLAYNFQLQQQFDQAQKTYLKCSRYNNAEAFMKLGQLLIRRNRIEEGIENLEKANCLRRYDKQIETKLVYGYSLREDTVQKALGLASLILKRDPMSLQILIMTAHILQRQAKIKEALQICLAIDTHKESQFIKHYIGTLYLNDSNVVEAFKYFKGALQIKSNHVPSLIQIGTILSQLKPKQAISILNKALEIQPANRLALTRLAKIYESIEDDPEKAMEIYRKTLQTKSNYQAYMKIGNCQQANGSYLQALVNYRQALNLKRTHSVYMKIAQMNQHKKQYKKAIQNYQLALQVIPKEHRFYDEKKRIMLSLAKNMLVLQEFDGAIATLETLVQTQETKEIYSMLGQGYLGKQQFSTALQFYLKANNIQPQKQDIQILENLALCFDKKQQFSASKQIYQKILQLDPHNMKCMNNFANILLIIGNTNEALYWYEVMLQNCPKNIEKRMRVAGIYEAVGDWSKVQYHLLICYRQKEHDLKVLEKLINLYKQKRQSKLVAKYQKKLALLKAHNKKKEH